MEYYSIEIKIEPEFFDGIPHFFWCIIKNNENTSSNVGHGWSKSIELAAKAALNYYNNTLFNR